MTKEQIYLYVEDRLEDVDFETILEDYDLTPQEVFYHLYTCGQIDDTLIILQCDE